MSLVAHGIISAIPMKVALKGLAHELAEYHNKDTGLCCPSLDRLAHNLCCDERSVRRYLSQLEEAGIIRREERFVEGRQTTTNYLFVQILSPRGDATVPPGEDRTVPPGEDRTVPQNQNKEPKGITNTPKGCHFRGEPRSFEQWWGNYPKKVGKQAAIKAWNNLTANQRCLAYADCMDRLWPDEVRFVPNPATYLHGRRWEDEAPREPEPIWAGAK